MKTKRDENDGSRKARRFRPIDRRFPSAVSAAILAATFLFWPRAGWAGGVVANWTDADLRAAMAGGGMVTFACDGTIRLASTIIVAADTVLDASGRQVTISGGGGVGIFSVWTNVSFTLLRLSLADGRGAYGGAILNNGGTVNTTNCTFSGNAAVGEDGSDYGSNGVNAAGGAIHNAGTLNAHACSFFYNRAVGGRGADGITNAPYPATTVPGGAGGLASGGAILNLGVMRIDSCVLASNSVVGGGGGRGSDESANQPYSGPYNAREGGWAGDALGGCLFNGGAASLVNCTLAWNRATGGAGGGGGMNRPSYLNRVGAIGRDGGGAVGGICSTNELALTNCTLASDFGNGGLGGDGGSGSGTVPGMAGNGGWAVGGVFCQSGVTLLVNCAVASNSGVGGMGGSGCMGHSYDRWCGIFPQGYGLGNFRGTVADLGHNLSSDSSSVFTNIGSLYNTDPKLGPLADNGGPTLTMALLWGSPAIDAADTAAAPPTDQRAVLRPIGPAADIGAFEFGSPAYLRISRPQVKAIDVLVCGVRGQSFRVFASSDLSSWLPIATNQIGDAGTVLIHDNCDPGTVCRFYRLVMP